MIGLIRKQVVNFETFTPLEDHRSGPIRHLQNFKDMCYRSNFEEVIKFRVVNGAIPLGNGSKYLILLIYLLYKTQRFIPSNGYGNHHPGKKNRVPEGKNGKYVGYIHFLEVFLLIL